MVRSMSAALTASVMLVISICAQESPGRRDAQDRSATPQVHTLTVGGRERSYQVHDFARAGVRAPLVIVLHGGGGNAENAVQMTGFDRVAARDRFVVVYPDGTSGTRTQGGRIGRMAAERNLLLTWNAGHCCAAAMDNRVDDVAFIGALIDTMITSGRVDPARVYVTGMSNGAMMTHRIGRELSTKVAAIAPVVGALFGDEPAPRASVPAFIIVGAQDHIVPAGGGSLQVRARLPNQSAADHAVAPAFDQATYWARHNGCGEPVRTDTTVSSKAEWTSCRSGAPVIFHSIKGNGHAWPGGRAGRQGAAEPARAFDATEEMWTFFKAHTRALPQ